MSTTISIKIAHEITLIVKILFQGPRFVVPCRNTILGCTRKVLTRTGEILDDHYTSCPYDYIIAPNTYGNCKLKI